MCKNETKILSSKRKHINKNNPVNECLSLEFKGPVPSAISNNYLLIVVDEFSRFPFAFPSKNTASPSVIKCLEKLFTFTGTSSYSGEQKSKTFLFDLIFSK